MLEVCSTTLPQKVLPLIFSDHRYKELLKERSRKYQKRAELAGEILEELDDLILAPQPAAAFYLTVVFNEKYKKEKNEIKIENEKLRDFIKREIKNDFN